MAGSVPNLEYTWFIITQIKRIVPPFLSLNLKFKLSDIFTNVTLFFFHCCTQTKLYLWSVHALEEIEFKMIFRDIIKCVDCSEKKQNKTK